MAFCTTCGAQIKDTANFCKYCGTKVKKKMEKPKTEETPGYYREGSLYDHPISQQSPDPVSSIQDSSSSENYIPQDSSETLSSESETNIQENFQPSPEDLAKPIDASKFTTQEVIEPISEDMIDILYSREREKDIKLELKDLLKEIEKIEQRLEVGLIGSSEASKQIQEKKELIEALREERKSLRDDKLPIEEFFLELKENQDKKQKLDEMRAQGKIERESVFLRLSEEIQQKIDENQEKLSQQTSEANSWLKQLEEEVRKLKDEVEIVTTRVDLGEIAHTDAQNRKEELEIDIYRKELSYHSLKDVLESTKLQ
ncbi:MAG: zinc-ribbon domain-containing protein [Candidatus Hodarchaeales archaeon]|jgi:DNA repair exonuclease SbcCD ATPase subunit